MSVHDEISNLDRQVEMKNIQFLNGQKIIAIHFQNNETLEIGYKLKIKDEYIDDIFISMENGQLSRVPWACIVSNEKIIQKWNLALVEGVTL